MDAIRLLTEDHQSFDALFKRFAAAHSPRLRDDLARRVIHEIEVHIALEEKYVYPIARERSGAQLDDHGELKVSLAKLKAMESDDRCFGDRLAAFGAAVLAHTTEEELHFFPALRNAMGRGELEALGRLIQNARAARPEEPAVGGLMDRAVSHLLASWKGQLTHAFGRLYSAVVTHS